MFSPLQSRIVRETYRAITCSTLYLFSRLRNAPKGVAWLRYTAAAILAVPIQEDTRRKIERRMDGMSYEHSPEFSHLSCRRAGVVGHGQGARAGRRRRQPRVSLQQS